MSLSRSVAVVPPRASWLPPDNEYATRLQSDFALEQDKIETTRNILIADRMLVHAVKRMIPLHKNIVRFLSSNNHVILHEYNMIRRKILKIVREIHPALLSER